MPDYRRRVHLPQPFTEKSLTFHQVAPVAETRTSAGASAKFTPGEIHGRTGGIRSPVVTYYQSVTPCVRRGLCGKRNSRPLRTSETSTSATPALSHGLYFTRGEGHEIVGLMKWKSWRAQLCQRVGRDANRVLQWAGLAIVRTRSIENWQHTIQSTSQELARYRRALAVREQFGNLVMRGDVPLYGLADGRFSFAPGLGCGSHRVVVCSLPKAGTYLCGELLKQLGLQPTNVHLSAESFTDYRFASTQVARQHPESLQRQLPLTQAMAYVLPGQFAVGHLDPSCRDALGDAKIIFVYRNVRDGAVSFLRWLESSGRHARGESGWWTLPAGPEKLLGWFHESVEGRAYIDWCAAIAGWLEDPRVHRCSFETLHGDHGSEAQCEAIRALYHYLEISAEPPDSENIARQALAAPTLTRSAGRSNREQYWNADVEGHFCALGGDELNRRLCYAEL